MRDGRSADGKGRSGMRWGLPLSMGLYVLCTASLVGACLYFFFAYVPGRRAAAINGWQQELALRADLRKMTLDNWVAVGLADGDILAAYPTPRALTADGKGALTASGAADAAAHLREVAGRFSRTRGYHRFVLLDANLRIVVGVGEAAQLERPDLQAAAEVLAQGKTTVDFHRYADGRVAVVFLARVEAGTVSRTGGGVVLLEADPNKWLYPYLVLRPMAATSGETVLVQREGEDIVFLSPLRNNPAPPLTFRRPANAAHFAAAAALRGRGEFSAFVDYRNEPVFAAAVPLDHAPWGIVEKVDQWEALAGYRQEVRHTGATAAAAFVGFWVAVFMVVLALRRRGETALRESEARFRDIFERSTIGKALSRHDGRLIEVNRAFADMLGFSIEELQRATLVEITHPDDIAKSLEGVRSVVAGKRKSLRMEERYRHRDGHWVFADTSATLLHNIPGTPPCLIASIVDISDRKRAEDELRFRNVVLTTQQEASIDGILVVDANGKMVSSNGRFAEMWGIFPDIMESRSDEQALQSVMEKLADPEAFISEVKRLYATPNEKSRDEIALKDGRTFDRYSAPMLDADRRFLGRVWHFRDITERKQAAAALAVANSDLERRVAERTAELSVSNQELASFAYAVSHDLRAPLRGIDGWSQAVLEDCGAQLDERGRTYLKRVRSETQRMAELIDGLLELSRVTRAPMKCEAVDLTAMVQEVEASLRAGQPERAVDFVVAPAMVAMGDAVLLRAALQNLLHNAWKFTGKRPRARIEVGCTSEPGPTVYHVRDDGAGFDMRYAGKLFAPFQRLHSLEEFPGTGIGLATVQRIIHRHGGKVWATAEVDQGATFHFTLTA